MTLRIAHIVSPQFLLADSGAAVKTAAIASALANIGELHTFQEEIVPWNNELVNAKKVDLPFGGTARLYSVLGERKKGAESSLMQAALRRRFFRHRHIARRISQLKPDIVIADDTQTAAVLTHVTEGRRFAHTHNVDSKVFADIADKSGSSKQRKKAARCNRVEQSVFPLLNGVFAVSESDHEYYKSIGLDNVKLLPNVVPIPDITLPSSERPVTNSPEKAHRNHGLFIGSLWWEPNADAADYLIEFSKKLSETEPKLRIEIIGRGASDKQLATAPGNLTFSGFVDDISVKLAHCSAVLIPLEWGGGTKIKTLEALAAGKPIVTTPEGARGLDLRDGEQVLIRPLGPDFDAAAIDVMKNPDKYHAMALKGRDYVAQHFSLQSCIDRMAALLS